MHVPGPKAPSFYVWYADSQISLGVLLGRTFKGCLGPFSNESPQFIDPAVREWEPQS